MGAHHSREKSSGEKGRRKKYNTSHKSTTSVSAPTDNITTVHSANVRLNQPTPSQPSPHVTYEDQPAEIEISKTPRYSPFYKRTSSSTNQVTLPSNPVKPVRHQVVLSDQVVPLSSLVSISRHLRRNNSTKSKQDPTDKRNSSSSSKSGNNNKTGRKLSQHTQKSSHYDTNSAISGLTSDDDDTHLSSSRSIMYSNSLDSASSMHLSPTQANFLNRRLSISNTSNNNVSGNSGGNKTSGSKYSPIVFDTTINPMDPNPPPQADSTSDPKKLKQQKAWNWVYDYGYENEYNRQLRQHYVLKQVFGNNIIPKLESAPERILDCACGIGLWTWETSQEYSNSDVIGLDYNLPNAHSGPWGSSTPSIPFMKNNNSGYDSNSFVSSSKNISFMHGDLLKPLPFEDNYFEFIHQREAGTFIPFDYWQTLLKEFHRILKVNGMIQLVEHDIVFKNPGPILAMINEWYRIAADSIGVKTGFRQSMKEKLEAAGFDDVQVRVYDIPIGEWSDDPMKKQHGFLYKEQTKAMFKSTQRWCISETGITQHEYERVCSEAMDEFEDYRCSVTWTIYTARKSPTSLATPPSSSKQNS